jgi:ribose/xylose/arabinose/galactoside ABC-type transport system permease subunit
LACEGSSAFLLVGSSFCWYLGGGGGNHIRSNGRRVRRSSSIYGIAAIGAAIVLISSGIDLSPGPVTRRALSPAVCSGGWLSLVRHRGGLVGPAALISLLVIVVRPLVIATLGAWASCAAQGSSHRRTFSSPRAAACLAAQDPRLGLPRS